MGTAGLNVWALGERRRRSAGTFDLERPEILVDSGPYAITRNPMYVGWWLIQLGAGSLAGSSPHVGSFGWNSRAAVVRLPPAP